MKSERNLTVRPMRDDEAAVYLAIHEAAIRGLAAGHYTPEVIEGWAVRVNDATIRELMLNPDREIRLIAELDGKPVGMGALVLEGSELRACYVAPEAVRRGCGSALVREIERLARDNGLTHLELAASLNAESFYAAHGYRVRERSEVVLRNGVRMPAVWMNKDL